MQITNLASILTSEVAPRSAEALIVYSCKVGKVARSPKFHIASEGKNNKISSDRPDSFISILILWCQHQEIIKMRTKTNRIEVLQIWYALQVLKSEQNMVCQEFERKKGERICLKNQSIFMEPKYNSFNWL